jgi:hypothetical protein
VVCAVFALHCGGSPPGGQAAGQAAGQEGGAEAATDGGLPVLTDPGEDAVSPVPATPRCGLVASGPHWLTEGEAVTFQVSCSTGWSSPERSFQVAPLPDGASFDPATGRFDWTPALDQAAVYVLTVREEHSGEQASVKIGVADNWEAKDNVEIEDPASYTEEYGLPVFHLSYPDRLRSSVYSEATLVYRGHTYLLEAKYRGATSLAFPKRSYTLKFPDDNEFKDPEVGWDNHDRVVLISPFNDNSYVRARLAFELWNRMSPDNIQVKTFSAVVFVNGRYWGLYTAAEHVDSDLMREHGLDPAGNLYKAIHADANFSRYRDDGSRKDSLSEGLVKKEGTPHDYSDLGDLIRFVDGAEDEEFQAGLPGRVRMSDYENWWIFVTLILATDNAGKNAYHYHDPDGGLFRFIPWDLDASFGQNWDTQRTPALWRPDFRNKNLLFKRLLSDPVLFAPVAERYDALISGPLRREVVLSLVDEFGEQIRPVALRDEARWFDRYESFSRWSFRKDINTHEEELKYVRKWIDKRWRAFEKRGAP